MLQVGPTPIRIGTNKADIANRSASTQSRPMTRCEANGIDARAGAVSTWCALCARPDASSMRFTTDDKPDARRTWAAVALLVLAYFIFDPVESAIYRPLAHALDLHMIQNRQMGMLPYVTLMIVRVTLQALLVAGICAILKQGFACPPLTGPRSARFAAIGLATGLLVMIVAILVIVAFGSAAAGRNGQSSVSALLYGVGWLVSDFIGATGEELYGRVALLLVAERLLGWRGAVVVSGLMFSIIHLDNPGASWMWLARLCGQGMLLAYAVYRTASVWWSIGYHTGWNWASAPLFGAAGSGFLDHGHLLDFTPTGPAWITGGSVGPEGSVFAFVAVAAACCLLVATTRQRGDRPGRSPMSAP